MMRTGAKSPNQSHKLMGSELAELDENGDLEVMVNSSMKMLIWYSMHLLEKTDNRYHKKQYWN